jgi:hypothetical protein
MVMKLRLGSAFKLLPQTVDVAENLLSVINCGMRVEADRRKPPVT